MDSAVFSVRKFFFNVRGKQNAKKNREANFTFAIALGICNEMGATACRSKDCATRRKLKSSEWCDAGIVFNHV